MELKWWRSQIGLVQQEPFLFDDTIERNVAYGLVGTPWEDEPEVQKAVRVWEACREAFADEFIARLPDVRCPRFCAPILRPPSPSVSYHPHSQQP